MNTTLPAAAPAGALAIICGGGSLPGAVAAAAERAGRKVVLFALRGSADPAVVERFPHHWIAFGQANRFLRIAGSADCREVVFIGGLVRPSLREVRFDLTALRLLPRVVAAYRAGDDGLIGTMARLFEEHGFRLVGAHEIAPEILVPEGPLTRQQPNARDLDDIALARTLLAALGPFDVGQGVVVADGRVLAVEAADGTDGMLAHVAQMRRNKRIRTPEGVGVLVKAPKPAQDRRFDLPAIGPRTVEGAAAAGLAGIAVVAGSSIVAEADRLAAAAERTGIFVVGLADSGDAA